MARKKKNDIDETNANKIELRVTNVFTRNMECNADVIVNRGGAGSGKSHAITQLLVYKFLTEKKKKILIIRKSLPSLRISVMWLLHEILSSFGVMDRVKIDKVGLNYYFGSNVIHLGSVDNPEKLKCFHPDTDILTKDGFKNVKDIKVGDLVASMNPDTRETIYAPVSNFYEYDFDGNMISPKSETGDRRPYTDFCVTPNHKMLTRTRSQKNLSFVQAKDLPQTYIIPQSSKWNIGNIVEKFTFPKLPFNKKANNKYGIKPTTLDIIPWLKFFGWYITEGNTSKDVTVVLTQVKEEGRKQIVEDLKDFPYKLIDKGDGKSFNIYGKDLTQYLKQFGTSDKKYIPREILDLHPSLLKYLFETLMKGDGCKVTDTHYTYCTCSKQLRDDVSEIAIKLGYTVGFREINTKKYFANAHIAYGLDITKRDDIRLTNKEEVPYKGKVYCIEVNPFHTVLSRYNGKIAWTGNSTEWNFIWFEEATEFTLQEFDLVQSRLRAPKAEGEKNQIFLSFNPIDESHWIKTELLDKRDNVVEIHSTYYDNYFLRQRPEYIEYLNNASKYNYNFYRVYALGEWGRLDDLIYNNWDIVSNKLNEGQVVYGIDFGYNAPSALIRCTMHPLYPKVREVWEEELIYREKLTNPDLIKEIKKLLDPKELQKPFYCDSAEPDRIKELKQAGINAKPANKRVFDGINFVQSLLVHVVETSTNIIKEKRAYSWKKDKLTNKTSDEPIPNLADHLQDAERYCLYTHFGGGKQFKVRWL